MTSLDNMELLWAIVGEMWTSSNLKRDLMDSFLPYDAKEQLKDYLHIIKERTGLCICNLHHPNSLLALCIGT